MNVLDSNKKKMRKERLMPNDVPRYIRIYDNGGKTLDRYTVLFTKKRNAPIQDGGQFMYLGMCHMPNSPSGYCQSGSSVMMIDSNGYSHLGKRISFDDLPIGNKNIVQSTYKDFWDLWDID